MSVIMRPFGITKDGKPVNCWRLTHPSGAAVEVLNFGATTRMVEIPNNRGDLYNVCMGYDSIEEYETSDAYSGAIVGRHAGRIGAGEIRLAGQRYQLSINDGPNHLHGGNEGFSHKIWNVKGLDNQIVCSYISQDGEEGYPGEMTIKVSYEWTAPTTLTVDFSAVCSEDTVASFTHHGYWNLSGAQNIWGHYCQVNAATFAATDEYNLPIGQLWDVSGTPFDFRKPKRLDQVQGSSYAQAVPDCGLDHTFPVCGDGMREMGILSTEELEMTIFSTLPALHIYTGKQTHVALEAQFVPNAVNFTHFPSTVLPAGQKWEHRINYLFNVK